ncbi:hypothetical protein EV13_0053 [Prochlorococcus sp. MIT 0702]|nr:hypothetical protein EV13_0053 [Prochlorococcus sp. MIT 0702]
MKLIVSHPDGFLLGLLFFVSPYRVFGRIEPMLMDRKIST